jgi:hypothetical protein
VLRSTHKVTGKKSYQPELHVVAMTVSAFRSHMVKILTVEWEHWYWDKWEFHADRLLRSNFRFDVHNRSLIMIYTDYAARVPLISAEVATCQSSKDATCGIAVALHSPEAKEVSRVNRDCYITETILRADGTEDKRLLKNDSREYETRTEHVFKTDAWRSAHWSKGNATTSTMMMRDMASYYKTSRFTYATRAWCDGVEFDLSSMDQAQLQPELPNLAKMDVQTDGAGSQYVCCKAARATAEFKYNTGVTFSHRRHEKSTGQGSHDSLGKEMNQYLRRMVAALKLDIDNPEKWIELCATGRIGSPKHPLKAHGDFAPNRNFYVWYSDEAIAAVRLDAEGVKGIKKYRHQRGDGVDGGNNMVFPLSTRCRSVLC